jgi:hypothetical protein
MHSATLSARAFCVEKNSVAPDVQVRGGEGTQAMLVVPYAEFVLTEVLKNALQVGVWGLAASCRGYLCLECCVLG